MTNIVDFSIGPIKSKKQYLMLCQFLKCRGLVGQYSNVKSETPTYIFISRVSFIPSYKPVYKLFPVKDIFEEKIHIKKRSYSNYELKHII